MANAAVMVAVLVASGHGRGGPAWLALSVVVTANPPYPPSPEFHGFWLAGTLAVPTAESTAFPPASRIAMPASAPARHCDTTPTRHRPEAAGLVRRHPSVTAGITPATPRCRKSPARH